MSTFIGFACLAGAIAIFIGSLPRAFKDNGLQRTVRLKNDRSPVPAKCRH